MKLNLQLFGGRGASSSISGRNNIQTYEQLISKANGMKYAIVFNKGIDKFVTNKGLSSITSHKISELASVMNNVDETIIRVDTGMYEKRVKALEDIGYKVIARSKEGKDKTKPMLVHIKKTK